MLRLLKRILKESSFTKALPVVPLVPLKPSEASLQPEGEASQSLVPSEPPDNHSPLTYGKVFNAIPRVTKVNTPNINQRISQVWGLPRVSSSGEFRSSYVEGREILR